MKMHVNKSHLQNILSPETVIDVLKNNEQSLCVFMKDTVKLYNELFSLISQHTMARVQAFAPKCNLNQFDYPMLALDTMTMIKIYESL